MKKRTRTRFPNPTQSHQIYLLLLDHTKQTLKDTRAKVHKTWIVLCVCIREQAVKTGKLTDDRQKDIAR